MQQYRNEIRPNSKLEKVEIAVPFIIAFLLSILGLYLNYKDIEAENGKMAVDYLPYFKITFVGILLTYLISLTLAQQHKLDGKDSSKFDFSGSIAMFCFGIAPIISLVLYPGADQLHLGSDSAWLGAWSAFITTQGFLFYRELKRNLEYKFDLKAVIIGTAINLIIVFATPYFHNFSGGSARYEVDAQGE